jgi:hypothetical protein
VTRKVVGMVRFFQKCRSAEAFIFEKRIQKVNNIYPVTLTRGFDVTLTL